MQNSIVPISGEFILRKKITKEHIGGLSEDISNICQNLINLVISWMESSCSSSNDEGFKHIINVIYILILNDCTSHLLVLNMILNNESQTESINKKFNSELDKYVKVYSSLTIMILVVILLKKDNKLLEDYKHVYDNIYEKLLEKLMK